VLAFGRLLAALAAWLRPQNVIELAGSVGLPGAIPAVRCNDWRRNAVSDAAVAIAAVIAAVTGAAARSETASGQSAVPGPLQFNRDIRPILVENCFGCHGADSAGRKADLRLDDRDAAIEMGAIVPGDPDSSVALDRIFSDDHEEVMPPPSAKKVLTAEQKALLERWIAEGAEYQPHWSFIPPKRPELPAVKNEGWTRNPIDRFILSRLEAEGLSPAPEADRRVLARRVSLDLTGLPPAPAIVDAFVADPYPDAYERLVDSLLGSLEWGEHRGRHWLDYSRYADTHGIHFDNYREMWTYRQWVVNAFNRNMPFDRFTILQLAGDLVNDHGPNASPEQILDAKVASGFHRCNMTTNEGGIIDEEYAVLYTRDRTETTAAVWMGLTAGCAVCHNHKFDPLSQKEFYELAAFFNNTTQPVRDGNIHDNPPILVVPKAEDRERFAVVEKELATGREAVTARKQAARPEFDRWITEATPAVAEKVEPQDTPLLEIDLLEGEGTKTLARVVGKQIDLPLTTSTKWQAGPSGVGALLLDGRAAELADAGDFEHDHPFSVTFWLRPPANDSAYAVVARMDEANAHRGWDVGVHGRRVMMHLVHAYPEDAIKVVSSTQLKPDAWTLVAVTYDGSGKAEGVKIYYDGKPQAPKIESNTFKKTTIKTGTPLVVGGRSQASTAHGVGLAGLALWGRGLAAREVEGLSRAQAISQIVKMPPAERVKAAGGLFDWWLANFDEPSKAAAAKVAVLESEHADIRKRGTVAHVMHEKNEMAKAYILNRGEYDKRGEEVKPDTPEILPDFPEDLPRNRLGLARWLLLQDHPLTTRVTVNRFWQEVFGTGLVRTSGDFGTTGELPSHPELLDWLAVEFRESGWDVKKLFRLMVTSAAYRQTAATTPQKLVKDADNRLLSRGPRFRMDAEMVRDHALAASGLLVRQIGGPSVKPYQPDGVWEAVSMGGNTNTYKRDKGENLYRRSMYWFWKRSAPPASMDIFNAPSRENCCVKRERTNTPLQALVTLNDPQFVEAARFLADRALEVAGDTDDSRIDYIAERLLARPLAADEIAIVKKSLADLAEWYKAHPDDAKKLIAIGDSKPRSTDAVQLASWAMLTNELMNLDEVLCK
jgi:cytochrome c553